MTRTGTAGEQLVVMESVSWSSFLEMLQGTGPTRGRMTYDQGRLEIMSPSKAHEQIGCLIGRMVEVFTEERRVEIVSVASLTVKSEAMKRAFEADEAYYIQHAHNVRALDELDFAIDPAPDLVIEVDISRSSIRKLPIFATFHVTEVWQYQNASLTAYRLQDGTYVPIAESTVLPGFPLAQIQTLLDQRTTIGETQLIRSFRETLKGLATE